MKRALGLVCVLALAGLAQSCVDDNSAVYISAVLAPDDDCAFAVDSDTVLNPNYDPVAGQMAGIGYSAVLRVESQLINRQTDIAADPSAVFITDADVTLQALDGSSLPISAPNPYRVPATGFIPSSDDGTPVSGRISMLAIPAAIGAELGTAPGGIVIVRIQVRGHTAGGLDIDSPPFEFSIEIRDLCGTPFEACMPGQDSNSWCG